MINLYNLIAKKQGIEHEIKQEKHKLHIQFVGLNKQTVLCLDIAIIIIILMNFGAVAITNALVIKKNAADVAAGTAEPIVLREANPAQSQMNNYEQHPDAKPLIMAFLRQALLWAVLLSFYIYYRRIMYTDEHLFLMIFVTTVYFILLGMDFFNDFGFFIGKTMFGG